MRSCGLWKGSIALGACVFCAGCAVTVRQPDTASWDPRVARTLDTIAPVKEPKRRIAIVRFENESGYGSGAPGMDEVPDRLAGEMLGSYLIQSGEFIVTHREGLEDVNPQDGLQAREPGLIGISACIYGSVIKYGIKAEARKEGLTVTHRWKAHAKVAIRMVDPLTGITFFSESGEAESIKERRRMHGFGAGEGYDSTLMGRALNAAIVKLVGSMRASLHDQPWRAGILDVAPGKVVIGAGRRAGLRPGQELRIVRPGRRVKDPGSGLVLELPGEDVGRVRVDQQFGSSELDEASVCDLIRGVGITRADRVELVEGL